MKKKLLWCIPILCFIIGSCTKEPLNNMTEEESRIYITNYDTTANFANYKTFKIADSVAVVSNGRLKNRERTSYDVQLVSAVTNALTQRGFTQVSSNQTADLGVTVSVINNTSTGVISYTDYGGYYNSYWDPYYFGYPGYGYYFPTYYGTYQVSENALTIDMFDLKNGQQNNQIRDVWSGIIRGEGIYRPENINSQIGALFNQSSYLKTR
jgi:hypothetical protein